MTDTPSIASLDASDCLQAIALAMKILEPLAPEGAPFKLIGVANLIKGSQPPSGPTVWEMTFKPARLVPDGPSQETGAGGEWFARIDLARQDNPVRLIRGE